MKRACKYKRYKKHYFTNVYLHVFICKHKVSNFRKLNYCQNIRFFTHESIIPSRHLCSQGVGEKIKNKEGQNDHIFTKCSNIFTTLNFKVAKKKIINISSQ